MLQEISHDKKELIFKIAKSIFAKYGYTRTTMDDIAKVMGMKKNSLYYYFPSKEAIFEEVIKRESESCIAETLKAVEEGKPAEEKIRKFVLCGLHYRRNKINLNNITRDAIFDIKYTAENFFEKFLNRKIDLLAKIIDEGIKNKEFKKINSKETADCILNLINAIEFSQLYKFKDEINEAESFSSAEKKIIFLLNLIIEGLKAK